MAKKKRPFVGPDLYPGTRTIYCRRCAQDCSYRVDGTWRHDADGSILEGNPCTDPDTLAGTVPRPALV